MGSLLSRTLLMAFGYVYPAYHCFKAVEDNNKPPQLQQLSFWCQYWILVAILTVCERIGDAFVSWLPLYNEVKLAFVVYLWYPKWKGTTYVYNSILRPYVVKHETEIDRNLFKAGEVGALYWHRALSSSKTRVFEILRYFSSQEPSEPYLIGQASPAIPEQLKPLPGSSDLSKYQFEMTTNELGFHLVSPHNNKRMISGDHQSCVKITSQLSETEEIQATSTTSALGNGDSNSDQEQTSNYKVAITKRRGIWRIFKSCTAPQ